MILTVLVVILVVAILIFINALYVAGEFSAVSARKPRIQQMADEGNRLAKMLLPVLKDPHRLDNYIAASQVGITLSSIVLGIYGEQQVAPLIEPLVARLPLGQAAQAAAAGTSAVLVLIVLTTLQVVFGELVPKSVGIQYPERMALATAAPMKWSADIILKPLIVVLNGTGRLLLRAFGLTGRPEHTHIHSPEEIVILVQESARGGLIDADERRMLRNVFRATETTAGEVMIPRPRLTAAEVNDPVGEVLALAANSAFSRIPLYEEHIDQIIGYVHIKDLFRLYRASPDGSVRSVLRQAPFVPESLTTVEVWERLNETESYLAIVFDEYGGTAGMVTREDLIEELFGELQDEFDQEQALVKRLPDGRYQVRGDMAIASLNDILNLRLPHEEVYTVGGLIEMELGRIPERGEIAEVDGVRLEVEQVEENVIRSVYVVPPPDTDNLPTPEAEEFD